MKTPRYIRWLLMLIGMVAVAQAETFTTLRSFTHADGEHPLTGLTASDDALLGTTIWGGSSNLGTLFSMNTDGTGYTVLKNFTADDDAFGIQTLTLSDGVLFGTASSHSWFGYAGNGNVFRVNTDGTDYTILKDFSPGEGGRPFGGVTLSGSVLYGTTASGGASSHGTVFKINTDGTGYTVLKDFNGGIDGAQPQAGLVLAGGVLYGTTIKGGSSDYGTMFKVSTNGTDSAVLKHFSGSDGGYPWAALTVSDGVLYGTTYGGGSSANGTVFKVNTDGTGFAVLKHFSSIDDDGVGPRAGVTMSDGVLYGTTLFGGGNSNHGTVFRLNTDGTGFAVLKRFDRFDSDGAHPEGGLCLLGGALYGTTSVGGSLDLGTVFRIDIDHPAVHYVSVNSTNPVPPYLTWATAANVIQDAVDVALPGDEIVVTNGVYETGGRAVYAGMTNRVAVTKPVTVRSVNGPDVTVIRGYQVPGTTNGSGAVRCVYLTNGAALIGFTLTNGAVVGLTDHSFPQILPQGGHEFLSGGGVWCESHRAVLTNCFLTGNAAVYGGGAFYGTLDNCTLNNNSAVRGGGGSFFGVLNQCTLTGNSADYAGGAIGGLFHPWGVWPGGTLNSCTLSNNSAMRGGGGLNATLINCLIVSNTAVREGGGAWESVLANCIVLGNSAESGGGAIGSVLNNCTVVGNLARFGGGVIGRSTRPFGCETSGCEPEPGCNPFRCQGRPAVVNNCIVYENISAEWSGEGESTNAPLFVEAAAGNFRLQSNSPCINAGRNAYAPAGPDLDGNPRIVGGTVDLGAYEFQSPQSTLSYAWLQQYGLPTDGSADFADLDGDGHNNCQEWRAWTDPTNSLSALRLLMPIASTNGLLVRWESVTGQSYFLERGNQLGTNPAFAPLASNVVGQAGETTFADTNAISMGPLFYRVGVQE